MVFLNPWILFALLPLFFFYKKQTVTESLRQTKLLYLSLAFMLVAVAQPAIKNALTNEKFHSQDYIIALDASYSMQANDLKPSRYILAKKAIKELLKLHPKDRFTIFAFTSNALLISPPTTDKTISIQALDALNPKYILTKSTNLSQLFKTIAKTSFKKKNLIIFSDGGDEHDVSSLVTLLKTNNITPYFVATASQKGSALKKDGKFLKNAQSSLVISKINPIIQDMVSLSDGYYYELKDMSIVDSLSSDLEKKVSDTPLTIQVQSYKELYFIPLIMAFILYFLAVTKLHQLYIFLPLLLFPYKANAGIFDFYYLYSANNSYKEAKYPESALSFKDMQASVRTYYNVASSYYKAKQYKNALLYFAQIKTQDVKIKADIYYNMANCAVKLGKFEKAKIYYRYSLILHTDKDAFYNLHLVEKLKENSTPKMPSQKTHSQQRANKKQNDKTSQKKKNASSSSQNSQNSSSGAGADKNKKKKKNIMMKKKKKKNSNFKMSYKAYEIINKGYADEKEPW
jgi:Ca-activated chloride channel family protein